MSAKWNLFVDLPKCTGCRNCFIAVKDEYVGNDAPGVFAPQPVSDATWFAVEHHERGRAPFTEVTYLHLLFDRHEILRANGAESESLYLGEQALRALGDAARREIAVLFPELLAAGTEPARKLLSGRLGRKMAARHFRNAKALVEAA